MNRGFTLIELSIVLVIIGLLVGGILVGQSLIDSAKISNFVSLISESDAAVNAFEAKYNGLPGDHKGFGGNGDGYVARGIPHINCIQQDSANVLEGEIAKFWGSLLPNSYELDAGPIMINNNPDIKKSFPMPGFGTKGSFLYVAASGVTIGSPGQPWCVDSVDPHNYYVLAGPDYFNITDGDPFVLAGASVGKRSARVEEMMAIDSKMDDSNPIAGNVRAGRINFINFNGAASVTPVPECSSGTTYNIINDGYECTPLIRLGAISGNLK